MSSFSDERGPVGLLADEFLARRKRGERPTIKEYCAQHPELAGEIRDVFEALLMVEDLRPGSDEGSGSDGEAVQVGGKRLQQVGDYRILCEIGRGGMGVVYEAEQQALGRRVALKVLPRTSAGDGSAQIRFQREARAAARMHHTNIVPVFDVGQDGDSLYYAMQRIHGQGLDLVIEDLKRLRAQSTVVPASEGVAPAERSIAASLAAGTFEHDNLAVADRAEANATAAYESSVPSSAVLPGQSELSTATSNRRAYFRSVAQIGVQTAAALSYAHSRGIIHRDIKPGNLILDTTGNVWVTDFGLAKTGDGGVTHTGDILGTVRYMSPERFRGQCDVRADVYALGMTLYEMLTLKPAYASGDRLKLIELIRQSEATSPRSVDGRIPRDLETIVMKAIDKDPKRRYQSADEMGEDLQRFVNDEPIKARRIGSVERLGRWCRRNPAVAVLLTAVLVLMAAGTAVSTWQAVAANRARAELDAKNAELTDEQAKVEERFQMAQTAIALFHTGVSEDMLLKNPQLEELRTKLLKEAAGFYAELEKLLAGQNDAKSKKALAAAYFQLGELTDKIGDKKEALRVHRKALALRRDLAAVEEAEVETRLDVARSLNKVAELLRVTGAYAGARAAWEEERDLAERLEAKHPTDAVRGVLAQSHHGIGHVLWGTGKSEAALLWYRKGLAIRQKLADANPGVTEFQLDLAGSHVNIGWMLALTGKLEEALTESRKGLAIRQKLADANPAVTWFQSELAWNHNVIGTVLGWSGKREEALAERRKQLAIWQMLADANPAVTGFQQGLVLSHNHIGIGLRQMGKPEVALTELRKAVAIAQKLADANPAVPDFLSDLRWSRRNLTWTLAVARPAKEALPLLAKELAADPEDILLSLQVASLQAWLGQDKELAATLERIRAVAKDTKDAATAERAAKACSILPSTSKAELEAALVLARKGVELDKSGNDVRDWGLLALGMAEYRSGNYAAANEALVAAAKANPNNPQVTGIAAFYRAMSLFRQGKEEEARKLALAAAAKMKPLPKDEQNPLANGAEHDDLILWLAYKEAREAIKFEEKRGAGAKPETRNKAKPKDGSP